MYLFTLKREHGERGLNMLKVVTISVTLVNKIDNAMSGIGQERNDM